jgi:L-asparaginase
MAGILLITTGGTIASRLPAKDGGERLASGRALFGAMAEAARGRHVELLDLMTLPSSQIGPPEMLRLARAISGAAAAAGQFAGCVVTHGTDTMEETATFLDLTCPAGFPVVITGAMRSGGELGAEGVNNLAAAIAVAAHPGTPGRGVLVVMNEQVHAARFVTKVDSKGVAAFESPETGPVGRVWGERVTYFAAAPAATGDSAAPLPAPPPPIALEASLDPATAPRVDLIRAYAGADGALVRAAVGAGARGIVVEGMGLGNLPAGLAAAAAEAAAGGCVVALATRCPAGPVAAPGGRAAGAATGTPPRPGDGPLWLVAGPGLNGPKARIALWVCLAGGLGREATQSVLAGHMGW